MQMPEQNTLIIGIFVVILYHFYETILINTTMRKFGEFVKEIRALKKISLRRFCDELEYDPSNWSKIERGLLPPPKSRDFIEKIALVLDLNFNSDEYYFLFDAAAAAHIPIGLISNEEIIEKLPIFFRASRGDNPNEIELRNLIALIKNS